MWRDLAFLDAWLCIVRGYYRFEKICIENCIDGILETLSVQFFPTMTARLTMSSLLSLPQIDTKWNKVKDLEDP